MTNLPGRLYSWKKKIINTVRIDLKIGIGCFLLLFVESQHDIVNEMTVTVLQCLLKTRTISVYIVKESILSVLNACEMDKHSRRFFRTEISLYIVRKYYFKI